VRDLSRLRWKIPRVFSRERRLARDVGSLSRDRTSYHQEGNSEKSLEYFDLGIQIIGDRSAPFMLGKLYTDMSGAYWFLRRPKDGIACLEKSIGFFEQTEHVLNSIIAYNNLGINLMLIGEWERPMRSSNARSISRSIRITFISPASSILSAS
jgi:tetratricopeptide (TPR) repeat protein